MINYTGRQTPTLFDGSWRFKRTTGLERVSRLFHNQMNNMLGLKFPPSSNNWFLDTLLILPIIRLLNYNRTFIFTFLPPNPVVYLAPGKNIVLVHDLVPLERTITAGKFTKVFGRHFLRSALRRADLILVTTEEMRSTLAAIGYRSHVWIPVVENVFDVCRSDSLTSKRFKATSRYILFIGTIEPRKNVSYLVKIAEELDNSGSNLTIKVAGRYGWGPKPPSHARVEYLGYLSDNEMREVIQNASLYVSASIDEGLGLPILETAFAALPVCAFRSAVPVEVMPKLAVALSGDATVDANNLIEALSDAVTYGRLCSDSANNLDDWNRRALDSHADIKLTLSSMDQ